MIVIPNNRQWRVVRIKPDGSHAFYNTCDTESECRAIARIFERDNGDRWIAAHLSFDESWSFDASNYPV